MSQTPPKDRPLRLVGLFSGGGRTLLNLHDCIQRGDLPCQFVRAVASRPSAGVQRLADRGLDVQVVDAAHRTRPMEFSAEVTRLVDAAEPDLVVMGGFLSLWLFPPAYEGRVMNIHPALLPSFGGRGMYGNRVHRAVLERGCKVSGCTVHFVTERYDEGPIILQRCVPVREGDTAENLSDRVFAEERKAYPEAVSLYAQGRLTIAGRVVRIAPAEADATGR